MARPTLERNVKFKALIRRLRIAKPYVRGLLETLWDVAGECGNPIIGSPDDVELAAEWPGKKGVLFEAFKDGRWIEELEDGRWQIHDYWDHAPDYVKDRKRKEEARKHRRLQQEVPKKSGTVPEKSARLAGLSATPARAPAPAPLPPTEGSADADRPRSSKGIGMHQELVSFFVTEWGKRFAADYDFQRAKDGSAIGRILKACKQDVEKAKGIILDYLEDHDPFIVKNGHTVALLASQINRYLAGAHKASARANGDEFWTAESRDMTPEEYAAYHAEDA